MSIQAMFMRMFNGLPLDDLLAIERALIISIERKRDAQRVRPRFKGKGGRR